MHIHNDRSLYICANRSPLAQVFMKANKKVKSHLSEVALSAVTELEGTSLGY